MRDEWRNPHPDEAEQPLLLPDSALFYRAVREASDLYAACTDFRLPRGAAGRRGTDYRDERIDLDGTSLSYRSLPVLRLLGASERVTFAANRRSGSRIGPGALRRLRFDEREPLQPGYASLTVSGHNYLLGARARWSHSAGKGWRIAAAVEARTGRDLQIEGVFTDALRFGLRLAHEGRHGSRLALLLSLPLSESGGRMYSTEEAFRLTGDRLYNPAWGYQQGKVRNSLVRREIVPLVHVRWQRSLSAGTTMTLAAALEAGRIARSGLNWYNANTPIPDHYRYLPSFTGDRASEEAWSSRDPRYTQIDWDRLIRSNRLAGGETRYTLEDRVERPLTLQAHLCFDTRPARGTALRYGVEAAYSTSRRFKQMRDLLGAERLTDIDQYIADGETFGNLKQNDLRHPDRQIGEGDRFGYDYALQHRALSLFAEGEWQNDRWQVDFSARIGRTGIHRRGYFEKELFPGEGSFGPSRTMRFHPWLLKAAVGYACSPRTHLELSGAAAAQAPEAEDLFYQPLYNNRTVEAPAEERIYAAEARFRHRGQSFDIEATAYLSARLDGIRTMRYYDDTEGCYCDLALSELSTCTAGIEASLLVRAGRRWQLSAAITAQQSRYLHNPLVTVRADADNRAVDLRSESFLGSCRPAEAPSWTAAAGASYFAPKGWSGRLSAGWIGGRRVDPSPLLRTERILRSSSATPEAFDGFVRQQRLSDAFTLDLSIFKRWQFSRIPLTLSLNVLNLTDNRAELSGYESSRIRRRYAGDLVTFEPHPVRCLSGYPRSFILSVNTRF